MPYPGWSDKDLRMYQHVKASTGSKTIAAATVNKHRSRQGRTRRSRRRRRT